MSEEQHPKQTPEEAAATRRQLEALAARTGARDPFAHTLASTAPVDLLPVLDRLRIRGDAEIARRAQVEREEAENVALGAHPSRLDHETREQWSARFETWEASESGRGWREARARAAQAEADRIRRETWPAVVEALGVPLALAELVAAGQLEATDALVTVRSSEFRILVLAGNVGVGKSVAAAWWLLAPHIVGSPLPYRKADRKSLWVSASRLARWQRYDDDEMARLLLAPRLVIDDLYAEFSDAKGNFISILDEVVSDRLANKRPLVITTNATIEVFRERYGERVADRIREHGWFQGCAGESMRRRG